ncbi:MAG: amidohydrolase family protein [Dehalococcoidia bacterium]|nr:amidohydrolase family protein [Dehalococcoidia bacterium]
MEKEELKKIKAIDTMCHFSYCKPELAKAMFERYEYKVMATTTFKGVVRRLGLKPGEEWKALAGLGKGSVPAMIEEMDEIGVDYVFIETLTHWSWHDHRLMSDVVVETIAEIVEESKGRVIGGAGYNPFRISESLRDVERAVKDYGFKWVWFHPISFGMRPDDRRCYPLYAKCLELGIPVCMQSGHSAEPLPSEAGHPMCADNVAIDFPELKIVLTHTGWPWVQEWISMIWRHPNVYGNIGAYYPKDLDPAIIQFMDGRGQDKVMWATRGFGLSRCKQEFLELPIREQPKVKILRENAVRVFGL